MDALTHHPPGSGSTSASQKDEFKSAMDDLLSTLHSVDVRIKRQIYGLQEAGVIVLPPSQQEGTARPAVKSSLEPNAVGNVGNLDVGWLNSLSGKVERDMEAELWGKAREFLEKMDVREEGGAKD
jgi:hypothetical protein